MIRGLESSNSCRDATDKILHRFRPHSKPPRVFFLGQSECDPNIALVSVRLLKALLLKQAAAGRKHL